MIEDYNREKVVECISKWTVDDCSNTIDINWRYSGCSFKEYINDEGYIIYTEYKKQFHFYEATFKCRVHENYKSHSRNPQRLLNVL